jgi:hypothetical protein
MMNVHDKHFALIVHKNLAQRKAPLEGLFFVLPLAGVAPDGAWAAV